jgi:transcriptional regulator with XRE-family HTH domain
MRMEVAEMMGMEGLGRRLRVLRGERDLSLQAAADQLGIDRGTLRDLELGIRVPQDTTLSKIARGYGVLTEDLLEGGTMDREGFTIILEGEVLEWVKERSEALDLQPSEFVLGVILKGYDWGRFHSSEDWLELERLTWLLRSYQFTNAAPPVQ